MCRNPPDMDAGDLDMDAGDLNGSLYCLIEWSAGSPNGTRKTTDERICERDEF